MNKTLSYIDTQFNRLQKTQYSYTIKIWDGLGNITNHITISHSNLLRIQEILKQSENKE